MDHDTAQYLLREAGQYFNRREAVKFCLQVNYDRWLQSVGEAVLVLQHPHLFPPNADTKIATSFMGRVRELGPPYTNKRFRPLSTVMRVNPHTLHSTLAHLRNGTR